MDLARLTAKLGSSVKTVDDLAGAAEAILLAGVSRLSSWVISVPNAILVSRATATIFGITDALAVAIAVSLEMVGHGLVHTWQTARAWNAAKRKTDPEAHEKPELTTEEPIRERAGPFAR